MKTMNYASSAQSNEKKPTDKYDLVFLSGHGINFHVNFLKRTHLIFKWSIHHS